MKRVYFIKPVGMDGPIKIGCSQSPQLRREALDNWSPFALEIVAEIEGGFDLERRFHALFVETHQRREWFGWSKRLAATIAAIRDGTFDLATLPEPIHVAHYTRCGKGARQSEWNPARRFTTAYIARMHALQKRGMPWSRYCDGPSFNAYAYGNGPYAARHERYPDPEAQIRACERFADEMTAQYGDHKMKPVRWSGPIPEARAA